MEPLTQDVVSLTPDVAAPAVPRFAAMDCGNLAARIKRSVRGRTCGGVRDLVVEIRADGILLNGHCDTFYCKQLAQHAAMRLAGRETVINHIEVD
jgi:hypothetical protein